MIHVTIGVLIKVEIVYERLSIVFGNNILAFIRATLAGAAVSHSLELISNSFTYLLLFLGILQHYDVIIMTYEPHQRTRQVFILRKFRR